MSDITLIGITDWRNQRQPFGIKDGDRLGHIYVIGKTGTGKSTLLQNMAKSDVQRGNGLCIIDPHGDVALNVRNFIPEARRGDLIYFDATNLNPIGFNPLSNVPESEHYLVTSNLISAFKKVWADSWGPRLEHILRHSILTLLNYPPATLLHIQPLLTDPLFRHNVLFRVSDKAILAFWHNEYDKYPPAFRNEAIAPVLNKIGLLTSSMPLRSIFSQETSIDIKSIMNNGKILICNLSKGAIGEDASSLLGSILLSTIQASALSRSVLHPSKRAPFYLYVDEIHSFATLSFADMLAEVRKYGLSLFLTNQYIEQLDERIRTSIFGNVGTLISFRVGARDAEYLETEFYAVFDVGDFIALPRFAFYIKLMIDGATSKPFSAKSIR